MPGQTASASDHALVLLTSDERDLMRIVEDHVQAIIYEPRPLPAWLMEAAAAVEAGVFLVPRTVLPSATADEIEEWLAANLSLTGITPVVRDALLDDIIGLVSRVADWTGTSRFMLRIFSEPPTTECGFHVDTVPRGAPPCGILRVYNGAGTAFVEPGNLTSVAEFYRYLGRRERLERERREARSGGSAAAVDRLEQEIRQLDEARPFLERPDEICVASAGSIVAFKHLDVGLHWTSHAKAKAWIHCSPMHGLPRLVVNITSSERYRRRIR